jgi:hypothetical protein
MHRRVADLVDVRRAGVVTLVESLDDDFPVDRRDDRLVEAEAKLLGIESLPL